MQGLMIIMGRVIHNPCDVDIAGLRQHMADTDAGSQASASQGDQADMLRNSQGSINGDNIGIFKTVV